MLRDFGINITFGDDGALHPTDMDRSVRDLHALPARQALESKASPFVRENAQ